MIRIKRAVLSLIIFIFLPFVTAHAVSVEFDNILNSEIKKYGVFGGSGSGVVYASIENFEESDALFIAEINGSTFCCKLFDDIDGIQCTDILSIPVGKGGSYTLSLVTESSKSYIMLNSSVDSRTAAEIFSVRNDAFTRVQKQNFKLKQMLMSYADGSIKSLCDPQEVYYFLNSLKGNRIKEYSFTDDINVINDTAKLNIRNTISASADITSFDIKNYDYDRLMMYLLNTNKNFGILTALAPGENSVSDDNIGIVNSDYIDYILEHVFRLSAEHPASDALISRGFSFNNDCYYYKKIFNSYYSTDIYDITHIYNIGSGVYFVIFTDIYRTVSSSVPEYSFAVVQLSAEDSVSLLRLGMGAGLPPQSEIESYAPL